MDILCDFCVYSECGSTLNYVKKSHENIDILCIVF